MTTGEPMIAAWYDRQGPAADVLEVGELPAAEPGPGEVRVRLGLSGANPGDMKKRQSWRGTPMAFPRIVAHRAVFADGPVTGQKVLVHGVRGSVSSLAAQLARWAGAIVIGTVRTQAETDKVSGATTDHVVALDSDPVTAIRRVAPDGVDRIIDGALSANADLDAAIVRNGAVLAAYASPKDRPELPFWPMLFANVTIRLLGSDDFPQDAKDAAARDLSEAAAQSALWIPVAKIMPLTQIAAAHELIESGSAPGRVLVSIP